MESLRAAGWRGTLQAGVPIRPDFLDQHPIQTPDAGCSRDPAAGMVRSPSLALSAALAAAAGQPGEPLMLQPLASCRRTLIGRAAFLLAGAARAPVCPSRPVRITELQPGDTAAF
jgi:hypothetical protein